MGPVINQHGNMIDPADPSYPQVWKDHFEGLGNEASDRQVDEETAAYHDRVQAASQSMRCSLTLRLPRSCKER
jgi:hypothetical protein